MAGATFVIGIHDLPCVLSIVVVSNTHYDDDERNGSMNSPQIATDRIGRMEIVSQSIPGLRRPPWPREALVALSEEKAVISVRESPCAE